MLILPPFKVGATATLYAVPEAVCHVTDPQGVEKVFITPGKRVDIPLPVVGTYEYAWSDGTTGQLVVVADGKAPVVVP